MGTKLAFVEQKGGGIPFIYDPRLETDERTQKAALFGGARYSLAHTGDFVLGRRYPEIAILLARRDAESAFKWIHLPIIMLYHAGLRVAN